MKNESRKLMKLTLSMLFFAMVALIVSSCSKTSDDFSSENTQTANNESSQEATTDELDDIATVALNGSASANGRSETILDERFCADTQIDTTTAKTIKITFGPDGCTDKKGNVRKGQIIITWSGTKWFIEGSSHTITLNGYSVNGVTITGTRIVTCTAFTASPKSITWTITGNHSLTWPDLSTATRTVNKTRKWDHTATEDTYTVSNGPSSPIFAAGINRHLKVYSTTIATPLIYLGSCIKANKAFFPVKGTKIITLTDTTGKTKLITLDYGDGTCDNTFTVSVDGKSKTLTAKNDSSVD